VENPVMSFVARFCKAGQAIIVRKNCDACKLLDACPVGVSAVVEAGSLCPFCSKVTHCTLVQEQRSDCGFESVKFLRLSFVQLVGEYRTAYEL